MFNKPATGLFGTSGNTSFGFGTQPSTGGLFGQSTAAPASTGGLFGGSSTFGSTPAGSTGFSFGTATATVQPTLQTATGGGLFGSSTTGFGVATAPQAQGSLSLFGSTSQPMNGGAFGAQANPSGSLFGGSSFLTASGSSTTGTVVKFVPVTGTDVMMKGGTQQNVATKLQCITGMKEYEGKSLEELRLEDYSANRKGGQTQQQTGLGFLGATSQPSQVPSAFGLFGPPTKPTFTGFASTPSTGTTSSLFGQTPQSAAGSLFGATSQQKPLFGSAAATTSASPFGSLGSSTTLFGQNTTSKPGIFGATPATQSTSLFGSAPAAASNTPGFGSTSGFGSNSTFGTTATSGALFGQKQTTGFAAAAPAQATSFSFGPSQPLGANTNVGGLFGTKPAASTTGFGFGQSTNTGFTGFGTAAITGTLPANPLSFSTAGGTGLNMGGLSGTSLFQASKPNAPTALGFTGFNQTGVNPGLTLGNTSTTLCNTGSLGAATDFTAALLQQQQQIQQQLQVLNTSPYGDSPLFRNLKQDPSKKDELLKPTNPVAQKAMLAASSQLKVTGQPNYRIKPKPLQSIITGKGQLFDGLEEDESSLDRETFVPRRNFKKLVIKNTSGSAANSRSLNGSETREDDHQNYQRDYFNNSTGSKSGESSRGGQFGGERLAQFADQSEIDDTIRELHAKHRLIGTVESGGQPHDSYSDHDDDDAYSNPSDDGTFCHPTGITLRRPDYFTLPSLNELVEMMDANGECVVENFVVGRDGYGNVVFPGFTNVAGLNLDEIVHFRSKEIDIYPNEENKPPFGEGLNKKAQVTLDRVWPVDKTTNEVIKDYDRLLKMGYLDKLEKASRKIGAKFIDYRHETGSWVFEVKHFSKYGLLDDSDDDDEIASAAAFNKNVQQQLLQPQQMKASQLLQKQAANQKQQEIDKAAVEFELGSSRAFDRFAVAAERAVDEEDSEMPDIIAQDDIRTQSHLELDPQEELDVQSSSFCLARSLGISAKQIQLQKASFFGSCEDEYMDICQHGDSRGILQRTKLHFDPLPSKLAIFQSGSLYEEKALPKHNSWAEISYQEMSSSQKVASQKQESPIHTLVPSALSTCQKVQQAVQLNAVSYSDSVMADKQSLLMDLGLVNCRRSRVGWASGWNLAHIGQPLTVDEDSSKVSLAIEAGSVSKMALNNGKYGPKKSSNLSETSEVVIESLGMSEVLSSSINIEDLMVEFLEVELMHSNHDDDDDANFPFYSPSPGVELLHSYSVKGQSLSHISELASLMSVTWNLCVALWGDLHLNEEFPEESYVCHQARRNALARWLTLTTEGTVEDEVQRNCAKGIEGSAIVFSYLSGGMIEKACEHALLCQDYHLALLIAQTTGSDDCKTMIQRQLVMWAETGMDKFISKDYLQLYSLLAGTLVWRSSDVVINTCAELDWKRCLALHLWFMCPKNATVMECLQEYERALQGKSEHGKYAALPRPLYMEKLGIEDEDVLDVCFHLLKLYSDRTHPLHVLLNPTTMMGNQLDYSLSWHLLQILNSLGYHHLSSLHHNAICSNYASQLESIGLWHWAVFVLLHIHDYNCRADAVRQVLMRHVAVEMHHKDKSKEEFIVNRLHVNAKWIHEAKAIKARAEGRYFEEAWHLIKAEKWNQCHAVVVSSVAPEAIINENFDMLEALLKPLSDASVSSQIRDWNVGGELYANYIEMLNQFHHLRHFGQVDNNVYELESLNELAASLSSLIRCMLSNNHIDSYCQAIMSKNITKVIDMLTAIHAPLQYLSMSVDLLSSLPLPEDFALETLAQMSHHALQAVLS